MWTSIAGDASSLVERCGPAQHSPACVRMMHWSVRARGGSGSAYQLQNPRRKRRRVLCFSSQISLLSSSSSATSPDIFSNYVALTLRDPPPARASYINICFCLHGGPLWPVLSLVAVSLLHTQPITRPWGRGGAGHRGCAAAAGSPTPLACVHSLWGAAERQQLGLGIMGAQHQSWL